MFDGPRVMHCFMHTFTFEMILDAKFVRYGVYNGHHREGSQGVGKWTQRAGEIAALSPFLPSDLTVVLVPVTEWCYTGFVLQVLRR